MSSESRARTVLARNAAYPHQPCARKSRSNPVMAAGTDKGRLVVSSRIEELTDALVQRHLTV